MGNVPYVSRAARAVWDTQEAHLQGIQNNARANLHSIGTNTDAVCTGVEIRQPTMLACTPSTSKRSQPASKNLRIQCGPKTVIQHPCQTVEPLRHTNLLQNVGAPSTLAFVIVADDIATMDIMCSYATAQKRVVACRAMVNNNMDHRQIKKLTRQARTPLAICINWGEQTAVWESSKRWIFHSLLEIVGMQRKSGGTIVLEAESKYWPPTFTTSKSAPTTYHVYTCSLDHSDQGQSICQDFQVWTFPHFMADCACVCILGTDCASGQSWE